MPIDSRMNMNVPAMTLDTIGVDIPAIQNQQTQRNALVAQTRSSQQEVAQRKQLFDQNTFDMKSVQNSVRSNMTDDGEVDWEAAYTTLSSIPGVSPTTLKETQGQMTMWKHFSDLPDDSPEKWYGVAAAIRGDWDMINTIYRTTQAKKAGGGSKPVWQLKLDWGKDPDNQRIVQEFLDNNKEELGKNYDSYSGEVEAGLGWSVLEKLERMGFVPANTLAGIPAKKKEEDELRPGKVQTAREVSTASSQAKVPAQLKVLEEGEKIKRASKIKQATAEAARKMGEGFGKMTSLVATTWDRKLEQLEETGAGLPATIANITMEKLVKWLPSDWDGLQNKYPKTAAYAGQLVEMASTIMPIMTGSVRLVESIYNKVLESLPSMAESELVSLGKLYQTIRNMYGLNKALERAGILAGDYTEEELEDENHPVNKILATYGTARLTSEDQAEFDKLATDIFGTPEISNDDEYKALPSGILFIDPEGNARRKPWPTGRR